MPRKGNHPTGGLTIKSEKTFQGDILRVNLKTGKTQRESGIDHYHRFLGGRGVNQWLLYQEVPPNTDPYSDKNKLIIGAGALVGTSAPCSARTSFDSLNPFTGGVGSTNAGGHFGPMLRTTGIDHIIIEGKAKDPVYLWITDDDASIISASDLWGATTETTTQKIKEYHEIDNIETAVIGPAGENIIKIANIVVSQGRIGGRCGLGSIMGNQKLKAIAVSGSGTIPVVFPEKLYSLSESIWAQILQNDSVKAYHDNGTVNIVMMGNSSGVNPVYNNLSDHLPEEVVSKFTAENLQSKFMVRRLACFNCRIGCSHLLSVSDPENPSELIQGEGIQANTVNNFGCRLGFENLEDIVRAHLLCTRYGIDIDGVSCVIAWAIECWNRGLLTEEDTGGLILEWHNPELVYILLKQISQRSGFGKILADGVVQASKRIGRETDKYALQTKGKDLYESCRVRRAWSLGVALDQRGGGHLRGTPVIETPQLSITDIKEVFDLPVDTSPTSWQGKPELVVYFENFKGIIDAVNICYFSTIWASIKPPRPMGYDDISSLLEFTLGTSFSATTLQSIGSRIHHVEKAINIRNGLRKSDDDLPSRFFMPAEQNPEGPFLDRQGFLDARTRYYQLRNWDPNTGLPSPKTFRAEGLPEIAKYFETHPIS